VANRFALLGGATAGLAASPAIAPPPLAVTLLATLALACLELDPARRSHRRLAIALAGVAALAGLTLGAARLRAIDAGAYSGEPGEEVRIRGFVDAVPRRSDGRVEIRVDTADGRLLVAGREPLPEVAVGEGIVARGSLRPPEPWRAGYLAIHGIRQVAAVDELRPTAARRTGLAGLLDSIRRRAEAALERGIPDAEAALARGFVLGQDDRIDPATAEDFRRSGLAHLLAVSGQNVVLLTALAIPLLAIVGVSLRTRLVCLLVLIAIYVPVAGAGPSIQRAGMMGAATLVAALASRPSSRWYVVLLAAALTLALNPRASGDIGWQLSFAAVVGIALWSRALARSIRARLGGGDTSPRLDWRAALAEGFGVTFAATLATAPLIAHHFDAVPLASLPANLLALPAVAPVMWLGMLSAALGQVPALPVEPLNALCGLLIAYIEQIAHWLAAPEWSLISIGAPSWPAVAAAYAALAVGAALVAAAATRRGGLRAARPRVSAARPALIAIVIVVLALGATAGAGGDGSSAPRGGGLSISFLDVGQGDAILLDPPRSEPLLVDAGPANASLGEELEREGVEGLAAAALSHEQSDHAGGLVEILDEKPVGALLHNGSAPDTRAAALAAGVPTRRLVEGDRLRFGELRVEVLWPPDPPSSGAGDPNPRSLVLLARWRHFSLLLTGDAEAEAVPLDPGPVDVLKIAHHGSEDAGLPALLDRLRPRLAVISAGEGNPYGHPAPATLEALTEAGVPVLRTDLAGEIELQAGGEGWAAAPE
jgi:competence protein ComEC